MKVVKVRVEGTSPLLMHRFTQDNLGTLPSKTKKRDEKKNQDDAESYLYKDENGNLVQPSTHLIGAMKKAGAQYQIVGKGKSTYKNVMGSGAVIIERDMIPHEVQEWEPDIRAVVIQSARVMRTRPVMKKWALAFGMEVDDDEVPLEVLKEILDYAGRRVGIGDFRPEKGGPFGRFIVTNFEVG